jgi:hypothetical protein
MAVASAVIDVYFEISRVEMARKMFVKSRDLDLD